MSGIVARMATANPEMNVEGVSPGVSKLVALLRGWDFDTTDSGDGTNFQAGMETAIDGANVFITVRPENMVVEADRLYTMLVAEGIDFKLPDDAQQRMDAGDDCVWPMIQATYDPHNTASFFARDRVAVIALFNVCDDDIEWAPSPT